MARPTLGPRSAKNTGSDHLKVDDYIKQEPTNTKSHRQTIIKTISKPASHMIKINISIFLRWLHLRILHAFSMHVSPITPWLMHHQPWMSQPRDSWSEALEPGWDLEPGSPWAQLPMLSVSIQGPQLSMKTASRFSMVGRTRTFPHRLFPSAPCFTTWGQLKNTKSPPR